ncbi:DeoR family transcriptional regulator [Erythrobacter arachoides]|uniref:DeoR family transcriptional regulator n=1 Tax=Aurantiacibacter arachoides TaxID=1850444 RepID=A0A844ZWC8_9SPHN|nr:DeoR/GlpR family DNA-binding transcription regulator [Aurantiacibacter arachoides]MXO92601.1 DeoR family transcriptional regulator [Aurantiacibacter arachoides]GGD55867.1 DeoR family transcriptional regulator [Aurantiacibacter arachoides]
MHATEREEAILVALGRTGFVSYRDLEASLDASPATIRRDLARMEDAGQLSRVHGGARAAATDAREKASPLALLGTPFEKSIGLNLAAKRAIGKAAAALCEPGEGLIIDGGSTTYQMCPHLAGLGLQVLSNSLHIVNALLPQEGTTLLVPSGTIFREQNIILAPGGEDAMPRFHAGKLFMGAAAVGRQGVMQADVVLTASQRRFIECADEVVLLVDSCKFESSSGSIVCSLGEIDTVITDAGASEASLAMLREAGVRVILAS